jgi:hypothetical protein
MQALSIVRLQRRLVALLVMPGLADWSTNFRLNGAVIEPLTPEAEATTRVLRFNAAERVVERHLLQQLGRYPRSRAGSIL